MPKEKYLLKPKKEEMPFNGNYIKIPDCKDGYLYIIRARNATVGIYKKSDIAFTINRLKFNDRFLFDEYHWDTLAFTFMGKNVYGTAVPLKEIEKTPEFKTDEEKMEYLLNKAIELEEEKIRLDPKYAEWVEQSKRINKKHAEWVEQSKKVNKGA
jgi:hypothetical protein